MGVLITGAGGGLGTAVCAAFKESGATVIAADRAWRETKPFVTISADLTTADGCRDMIRQACEHGPLQALVHLVGGFRGGSPVAETTDADFDLMMSVNVPSHGATHNEHICPVIAAPARGRRANHP